MKKLKIIDKGEYWDYSSYAGYAFTSIVCSALLSVSLIVAFGGTVEKNLSITLLVYLPISQALSILMLREKRYYETEKEVEIVEERTVPKGN